MKAKKRDESGRYKTHPEEPKVNYDREPPAFSFKYLRRRTKYCFSSLDTDEQLGFGDKLFRLSQLDWQTIRQTDPHGLGSEAIGQDEIKGDGIPPHLTPDVKLVVLRFHGLKAMVGYRDREIFYILWFDRDFTLYDHGS